MRLNDEPRYGDAREVKEMQARARMLRPYVVGVVVLATLLVVAVVGWAMG
ncbi:hypothetical protein [Brevundimonas sp.]